MSTTTSPRCHALTIDVEDYFHATVFDSILARDSWSELAPRVVAATHRLLDLLAAARVRATWFVLGWVAQRHPDLACEIRAAGHEIASHGYEHRLIYQQSPQEFRADIVRARDILQDQVQQPITMYRAPTFSITARSLWALEILAEEGFTLDSSIVPVRHDRYGIPDAPARLHRRATPAGELWEFPPATVATPLGRVPVGGGGYFRLFPLAATRFAWRRLERLSPDPLMFYLHPWEIDVEQPRVAGLSRWQSWRHRVNLRRTAPRLQAFIASFRLGTISDALAPYQSSDAALPSVPQGAAV